MLVHAPVRWSQLGDAAGIAAGLVDATGKANLAGLLPLSAALDWLVLAGVGVADRAAARAARVPALIVGVVVLDLFRFGMGQNPSIPLDHAKQPTTAAIRFLQAREPARFAGLVPDFGITPLPADVAMRYRLQDARGYDYPIVDRYDELWKRAVAPKLPFIPPTTLASATPLSLKVLGMLGVRRPGRAARRQAAAAAGRLRRPRCAHLRQPEGAAARLGRRRPPAPAPTSSPPSRRRPSTPRREAVTEGWASR